MTLCANLMYNLLAFGPQGIAYVRRVLRDRGFTETAIDAAAVELGAVVVGRGLTKNRGGSWKLPKTPESYGKRPQQLFAVPQRPARRRHVCPHCGQPMRKPVPKEA